MGSDVSKGFVDALIALRDLLQEWFTSALHPVNTSRDLLAVEDEGERLIKALKIWVTSFVCIRATPFFLLPSSCSEVEGWIPTGLLRCCVDGAGQRQSAWFLSSSRAD